MKKLDQKDLMLSPKVVTDLTGSSSSTNGKNDGDNPNATYLCPTGHVCISGENTCDCSMFCNVTLSLNDVCCEVSKNDDSKCCVNPPFSVDVCELSEVACPETEECPETQICPTTAC